MIGEAKFFTSIDHNMGLLCVKKSALVLNWNSIFLEKTEKKIISNSAKITKKCTILNFNFDTLEAVEANLSVQNPL